MRQGQAAAPRAGGAGGVETGAARAPRGRAAPLRCRRSCRAQASAGGGRGDGELEGRPSADPDYSRRSTRARARPHLAGGMADKEASAIGGAAAAAAAGQRLARGRGGDG